MHSTFRPDQHDPIHDVQVADPSPTGTERVVAVGCVVVALVGVIAAAVDVFGVPSAIGVMGVGAFVISGAILVVIAFRISRRGGTGPLRSLGRALWGVAKFLLP